MFICKQVGYVIFVILVGVKVFKHIGVKAFKHIGFKVFRHIGDNSPPYIIPITNVVRLLPD